MKRCTKRQIFSCGMSRRPKARHAKAVHDILQAKHDVESLQRGNVARLCPSSISMVNNVSTDVCWCRILSFFPTQEKGKSYFNDKLMASTTTSSYKYTYSGVDNTSNQNLSLKRVLYFTHIFNITSEINQSTSYLTANFQLDSSLQPLAFNLDSSPKNFNPDTTKSAVFFFM